MIAAEVGETDWMAVHVEQRKGGSGQRAIIAASILKQQGYRDVSDSLGSMAACQTLGCPIIKE